jgi:mono/diheme cytochrome c family protein
MIPDLRAMSEPRDAAYWRASITDGIDGTLMPAFAKEKGGILSDEQIESLVKFLVETPLEPAATGR